MAMNPDDLKLANGERQPRNQARKSGGSIAHSPRDDRGRVTGKPRPTTFTHQALADCLASMGLKGAK